MPLVTTRPVCAPCVRICTALPRRRQPIILILCPAPGAIALRELFCILGLLCHAAVALRFRDFLHHKISKNGGQKMSYHNDPYRVDYLKSLSRPQPWSEELPPPPPDGATSGTASIVKYAIARLVSGFQLATSR